MKYRIGRLDDFPSEGTHCNEVMGQPILIIRSGTKFFACSAICTHDRASLGDGMITNDTIECPLHGSVFNLKDGSVEFGPAEDPLPVYEVSISDNQLFIEMTAEDQ